MTFCAESRLAQKVAEKQDFLCKTPSTDVPSVKPGVTVRPSCTASDNVTVKMMSLPSSALASLIVTAALSSLLMVPVQGNRLNGLRHVVSNE